MNRVENPSHYNSGGIECIDYIKQVLGPEGFISFCHGNLIKYQHRHKYKGSPTEDMLKAQKYLEWMVQTMLELEDK